MQNMKLLKSLLWTAVGCLSVGLLAAGAGGARTAVGRTAVVHAHPDAGAVDAVSTVIATGDVENVITPQAWRGESRR